MRLKGLSHFKAKVIAPCSKLLSIFKSKNKFENPSISSRTPTFRLPKRRTRPKIRTKTVRFRKPFSIKSLSFPRKFRLRKSDRSLSSKFKKAFQRKKHVQPPRRPIQKVRVAHLLTVLLRKTKDVDTESSNDQTMGDARSLSPSDGGHAKEPFPSPITPGYVRISDDSKKESSDDLEDNVEEMCKSFENYLVEMIVDEGKVKDLMDVEELLYCWRNLKSPIFIDLVCRFYGELCKDLFAPSEDTESTQETNASE